MFFKILLIGGGIALCSCTHKGRVEVAENHVQWDSVVVNRTCHSASADTKPNCSLQLSFIYPVDFLDKSILKSVQKLFILDYFGSDYANMTPEKAAEKYADDYISNMIRDEDKVQDEDRPAFEYYQTSNNRILYNRDDLLSVTVGRETFSGGAHNNHKQVNRVIDLKTGRALSEKDLFIDDYREDLAKIIVDNISASNNVDSAPELENVGFLSVSEIAPNGNFYVDDTGITYIYNEYDIAAYAVGPVVVQLPYETVRHLLRADSPLAAIAF
ncbi:MAG: DUF3298 and DUF4163 domain-containing protein [Tannerella sp.]|nr:DUF3298 and DUF4163 domain-containing protein [Tannerella sp.]